MLATQYQSAKLLILANTYPVPSAKYIETNCVAAVTDDGKMRRLFPIPYRLLDDPEQKFKKWQWIEAKIVKASNDHRPESYRLDVDSIQTIDAPIPTTRNWSLRLPILEPHIVSDPDALEDRRSDSDIGATLGVIRTSRLLGLDIVTVEDPEWSEEEFDKLRQDGLFASETVRQRPPLRKLPYRFYYRYECDTADGTKAYRHMITDWEVGALYWRCQRDYGLQWERYLRIKLEEQMEEKEMFFLLGTMHRFPSNWLIVSIIYPPKGASDAPRQISFGL